MDDDSLERLKLETEVLRDFADAAERLQQAMEGIGKLGADFMGQIEQIAAERHRPRVDPNDGDSSPVVTVTVDNRISGDE